MARHLSVEPKDDVCSLHLKNLLFGELPTYQSPKHKLNIKGTAKGTLRGGNLSVLYGLRGTPYDFPAEGTILFIEDIGERPYHIDRMMNNLKLGGVLEKLSGLIVGQFTEYEEDLSIGKEVYEMIADMKYICCYITILKIFKKSKLIIRVQHFLDTVCTNLFK